MKPRTSPLRTVLGELQVHADDPPSSVSDPRIQTLCREATREGQVITNAQGSLVGDLGAVFVTDILPPFKGG